MTKPVGHRPPCQAPTDGDADDGGSVAGASVEGGSVIGASLIVVDPTSVAGLRACLVQLQREAEGRGYALTAYLPAVASDAVLEDARVPGAGRPS
ncbi:MAG: hypothetical protein GVY27_08090 [Deinococcus-Thermus bacterium]|nr:hypothetical protein [Deinococcota bacterium]